MDAAPAPVLSEGELSESGMGLAIIHALVDRVDIGQGQSGRGTVVRMRRLRSARANA
jgi:anti-sigma regulatory factor (Ser/Thr protein kinase)